MQPRFIVNNPSDELIQKLVSIGYKNCMDRRTTSICLNTPLILNQIYVEKNPSIAVINDSTLALKQAQLHRDWYEEYWLGNYEFVKLSYRSVITTVTKFGVLASSFVVPMSALEYINEVFSNPELDLSNITLGRHKVTFKNGKVHIGCSLFGQEDFYRIKDVYTSLTT